MQVPTDQAIIFIRILAKKQVRAWGEVAAAHLPAYCLPAWWTGPAWTGWCLWRLESRFPLVPHATASATGRIAAYTLPLSPMHQLLRLGGWQDGSDLPNIKNFQAQIKLAPYHFTFDATR